MDSCISHPGNESATSIGTIEIQTKYRMNAPRKARGEDYLKIQWLSPYLSCLKVQASIDSPVPTGDRSFSFKTSNSSNSHNRGFKGGDGDPADIGSTKLLKPKGGSCDE